MVGRARLFKPKELDDGVYKNRMSGIITACITSGWEVSVTPAPFHMRDKGYVLMFSVKPYQPIQPSKSFADILNEWGLDP